MSEEKKPEPNRILVYLRIRPPKKGDPAKGIPPEINPAEGTHHLMEVQPDNKTIVLSEGGKTYQYDWVYDGDGVSQEDIYQRVTAPVIDNVFKGYWGTTLCYGQTGTGKSFTMCNFDRRCEGIIPRGMRQIFETVQADTERTYTIKFSFIQIYCDRLQDLFNPNCKDELKLNRDKEGVTFPGIVEKDVVSESDFRQKYEDGNQYRVVTATKMNPESSRGHAALFIQIKSEPKNDPAGEKRNGKLFLIDLAGYERFSKTGVQEGKMKEEAKTINASLLSLGNVVQSLSEGSEHIPWRNAKLTRMLEDAIGGKAKCSIILTAGPSSEHIHETMGTLYFGARAMAVKTNATLAVNIDYQKLAKKLQEMLAAAEGRINTLEVEATRRQLEREQTEDRMKREWAALKARQDEQLKKLLTTGATPEQIQELINANEMETEILEEQQREERKVMEDRHEDAIQEEARMRAQMLEEQGERIQQSASGDVSKLQRELQYAKQELDKYKELSKVAEAEARRLSSELNEAKISIVTLGGDASNFNANLEVAAPGPTAAVPTKGGAAPSAGALTASKSIGNLSDPDARKVMEQRINQVKEMLKEQHAAEMAEHLEPLQDELNRYKKLYEDLRSSVDEELQVQKDTLTQMYEEEIREIKETSNDVQEKLKKNHMTIKKSYQKQKEELQDENEELTAQVARLTEQLQNGGIAPAASAPSTSAAGATTGKQPSLAELMIAKKKAEKLADDAQQQLQDLKTEIDYVNTEKQALERQLREYEPKEGEERMKPAAVRKLRQDFDKMKEDKESVEKELFKLKAAQALSGPQSIAGGSDKGLDGGSDNAIDDFDSHGPSQAAILEQKEDMCGDFEGTKVFVDKMLKFPYFSGAQKVANSHQAIAGSLTTDLDDFRRVLRQRFYFLGAPGSGKSAILKCLTAASAPLIRSCPETVPTLHPLPGTYFVEDVMTSKNDLHRRYVKFEDIPEDDGQSKGIGFMSGMMSGLASAVGLGGNSGVSDPARIYIETLDFPGNQTFFRGFPPYLLPSKNVLYIITYNLTHPVVSIAEEIAAQLRNIHAAVHRDYNPLLGGDGPRVAVCLMGTHRDAMRDSRDNSVISFLNKVNIAIGPEFHKLRGDKAYGLQVVGNFATSAADWTVLSPKANAPTNFRDLCAYLATFSQKLYDNTPSSFLPTKKATAAFSSYMMGDDNIVIQGEKTAAMDPLEQRMRKGVITFLTALCREQKVRWLMGDREMRSLIAEHLDVDEKTAVGNNVVNFFIRELRVRNIITVLPNHIYEPKYLPVTGHEQVLPRDGLIVLDPTRLLAFYSVFIGGQWIPKLPAQVYKDIVAKEQKDNKNPPMFDMAGLKQQMGPLEKGVLTQDCAQVLLNRFIPMVGSDARLLFEFLCVMGLGTGLRGENAMLAPAHFNASMPPLLTGYMSFLVTNYGDGLGRKYQLTAAPDSFFARLQTILVPFGNAPIKDPEALAMNFKDGCFLILEKSRLKWGTYGSKVLKDAIVNIAIPVRGIIKLEGNNLYVACTGRSNNSQQAVAAVRTLMDGIHHHILALCRREFRGVSATFQEMQLTGVETKREKLADGIKSYVESMGGAASTVQEQLAHIGNMNDPAGKEIDNALKALPQWMYVE